MSNGLIAALMFASMLLLGSGQRIFAVVGAVATTFALSPWGTGGFEIPFHTIITLMNWYALLTLPLFVYMGYMLSESGIASDLYEMFHVWMGKLNGGLAIGTIGLMVGVSAMNGLNVAGMSIGTSIALPELLKRRYNKIMVSCMFYVDYPGGVVLRRSFRRLWRRRCAAGIIHHTMGLSPWTVLIMMHPICGSHICTMATDVDRRGVVLQCLKQIGRPYLPRTGSQIRQPMRTRSTIAYPR